MKTKIVVALTLIMGLAFGTASAQIAGGRYHHQRGRIEQGYRSGELNKMERYKLMKEQRRIHRHSRRARLNDGRISPRERKMLQYERRKADRKIYRYKHNRFDR